MLVTDIRKGDIITYQNGICKYVNKPYKYHQYFDDDFNNPTLGRGFNIVKIQRYVKGLCFYKLKTIYKRGGLN